MFSLLVEHGEVSWMYLQAAAEDARRHEREDMAALLAKLMASEELCAKLQASDTVAQDLLARVPQELQEARAGSTTLPKKCAK